MILTGAAGPIGAPGSPGAPGAPGPIGDIFARRRAFSLESARVVTAKCCQT